MHYKVATYIKLEAMKNRKDKRWDVGKLNLFLQYFCFMNVVI